MCLNETVPAGPGVEERAEAVRERLVEQVAVGDHPRSDATVAEMMDEYTDPVTLGRKTRKGYKGNHRKHIAPLLGRFKINGGLVDAEVLDTFYGSTGQTAGGCRLIAVDASGSASQEAPLGSSTSARGRRAGAELNQLACEQSSARTLIGGRRAVIRAVGDPSG